MKPLAVGDIIKDTSSFGSVKVIGRYVDELVKHVHPNMLSAEDYVYEVKSLEETSYFLAKAFELKPR